MCRRRRPARRRGRGPRSLFSWRRHRLFFPNRKPDGGAWPTPPRPPEALPARLRGGQRGPAVPAAPFPAAGPAPPPPPPGGWKGRRAGGWRGQERAFPRRDSACRAAAGPDGLGAQGGRAHLSRRGPPSRRCPGPEQPAGDPDPGPHPPLPPRTGQSPALTAAGRAAPAPRRRSPCASPLGRRLGCAPPLALARSRPGLLSSGAPGIKATADTGPRAEGPAAAAPGPPGGADRCGAGPRRPR